MREIILSLAKAAIVVALGGESDFDLQKALREYPALRDEGAVFVTLTQGEDERLRGCIGTLEAHQPLYKDIIANAQSAALADPRFTPLMREELDRTHIEVSLLSPPKAVEYHSIHDLKQKIRPRIDGVVLKLKGHRATYLPQVWSDIPDFDHFFASLCQKANLPQNCLKENPQIEVYGVVKYR